MPVRDDPASMVMAIGLAAAAGAVMLFFFSIAAIQAKRRGYSFFIWLFAGMLVLNPIYLLVVLGTAPHRKRQQLRLKFSAELDARLVAAGRPMALPIRPVSERSIGDLATMDPATTASKPPSERSLGDEATRG
jgi:hypothetical protein